MLSNFPQKAFIKGATSRIYLHVVPIFYNTFTPRGDAIKELFIYVTLGSKMKKNYTLLTKQDRNGTREGGCARGHACCNITGEVRKSDEGQRKASGGRWTG